MVRHLRIRWVGGVLAASTLVAGCDSLDRISADISAKSDAWRAKKGGRTGGTG